jgi:hypothetical protein
LVDDKIWSYIFEKYGAYTDLVRYGIRASDESEECIVEVYLKRLMVFPIPNSSMFKFNGPKTTVISRKATIEDLMKKV